ncbi:TetR/AcrR family transcriptional regulator [Kitasatospora sp. NPDC059571]|uniref:TetR/AcrR family transcriptional regulator n=1 Tax=Kitasatospora sp. NPDC059571 TaxID=3346871 RepID=UPI003679CD1B
MAAPDPVPSLRERKKQQTRARISGAAAGLFVSRGFDAVSVAEVAEAAEVSKMTVFNYFPRKEELLLDGLPEALELTGAAVRDRPAGTRPLQALEGLALGLAERRHPLAGLAEPVPRLWRTVLDSPALRAYARECLEAVEDHLAGLLAAEGEGAVQAGFTAALGVTALRTLHTAAAVRILAGESPDAVAADHPALVRRVFAAADRAAADFAAGEPSAGARESDLQEG